MQIHNITNYAVNLFAECHNPSFHFIDPSVLFCILCSAAIIIRRTFFIEEKSFSTSRMIGALINIMTWDMNLVNQAIRGCNFEFTNERDPIEIPKRTHEVTDFEKKEESESESESSKSEDESKSDASEDDNDDDADDGDGESNADESEGSEKKEESKESEQPKRKKHKHSKHNSE